MTAAQFVMLLKMSFVEYCGNNSEYFKLSYDGKIPMQKLKVLLLAQFMEIIEYYFRTTVDGDDNFCTEEEIQDIITHINRIMGTEYYFSFS